MPLLSTCCCCCSIRQGSVISAKYTMMYFTVSSFLSGSMVVQDVMNLMELQNSMIANSSDIDQVTTGISSNLATVTEPSGGWQQNAKTMQSGSSRNEASTEPPEVVSVSTPRGWSPSMRYRALSVTLLGLDFIFEVVGIAVSTVLLYGLQKERKALLIPWLVIVPLHTVLDACQVVKIMLNECHEVVEPNHECRQEEASYSYFFLFSDLSCNLLSIYIVLIVYSQYQEYEAGRGTAAYDGLMSRHSDASNFMMNPTSVNSSHRLSQSQNQHRRSYGYEKSDLWCDGLMMERVNSSSPPTNVISTSGGDRDTATTSGGPHCSMSMPSTSASASSSTDPTRGRQRFVQIDLNDVTSLDPDLLPNPLRKADEERPELGNQRIGQCVRFDCDEVQFGNEVSQPSTAKRARNDHHPRRNSAVHSDRRGTPARSSANLLTVPTLEGARRTSAPSLKQIRSGSLNV